MGTWRRLQLAALVGTTGPIGLLWGARRVAREGTGWIARDTAQLRGDLIIVPGAGLKSDGTPTPMLEDRLVQALSLWRRGHAEKILLSGFPPHSVVMVEWMRERGVPESALVHDPNGRRTVYSMLFARDECRAQSPIVCTQAFHLARSLWLARRLGLRATGFPVDRRIYSTLSRARRREVFGRMRAFVDGHRF